jgi:hypothetical protein
VKEIEEERNEEKKEYEKDPKANIWPIVPAPNDI